MGHYLLALLVGMLILPVLYLVVLVAFARSGTLPPPQFSNSICIDEKLASMRRSPPGRPNLLVVGSSVAWRHFNSPAAIEAQPGLIPYNAGFCGANIRQTKAVVDWLAGRLPGVEDMLLIVSPMDFEHCDDQQAGGLFPSGFDVSEADRFVFGNMSPLPYYLRYFDPWTLLRNRRDIAVRRDDMTSYGSLMINEHGDGPMEPSEDRRLLYGSPLIDATCFAELHQIGLHLKDRGIGFSVAMTPLHPEWLRLYDNGGQITGTLERGTRDALAGTSGRFIKNDTDIGEAGFFDAIHLRWSHTEEFTRSLLAQVRPSARSGI